MPEVDTTKIECNDTHAICEAYGIEAARGALVKEINAVFSHYGIKVDFRHLYLVADFMTVHGYVNPMSRAGMQHNTSPLVKMSFETTMKFLTDACLFNQYDNLSTPSGRLVMGRAVKNGTGLFDVKQDFSQLFN
jgi:DNA-directed RNA polymerase I subunit RPA1